MPHNTTNDHQQAVAVQVGYTGSFDIDSIESKIYFYQQRTVESLLELGKCLLVLKELTPHGEFERRLQLCGISKTSAWRFMNAVTKTSKSSTLELLSKQVKSATAFLELVTHDDDMLESVAAMDDIDRLSASQLRERLRSLSGDMEAKEKVLDETQRKLTRLQVQAKKKIVADTDWPDALVPISDQVAAAGRAIAKAISDLETCRITLLETGQALESDLQPKYEAALAHVVEVYEAALAKAERDIQNERVTFDKSLGAYGDVALVPAH